MCWPATWSSAGSWRPRIALRASGRPDAELFAVPGKVPLYLEGEIPRHPERGRRHRRRRVRRRRRAARLHSGGGRRDHVHVGPHGRADAVFFDGTLFRDDEMIANGTGSKTGRRMGHMSIDGADGSLDALAELSARRIYIHINNTNPILVEGSPERARVTSQGLGSRRGRTGDRPMTSLLERRPNWKHGCATSARGAITAAIRFTTSCTAASAPRGRSRPGRSTATTIRPRSRRRTPT